MVAVRNIPVISAMMLSIADQALAAPVAGAVVLRSETEAVPAIETRGIDERSPKNGQWRGLLHHAVNVVGGHMAKKGGRDLEYLDERDIDQLLDERGLDARSPKNGAWRGLAHHAIKVVGGSVARHKGRRDLEFLDERDVEDLEERDLDERSPKNGQWRGLLHHAVKVVGGHMANKGRRDLEAEELLVRALESLDERGLDERSPKNGQWRKLAHHAINVVGGHMANRKGRRDLGMEDLVARELQVLDERDLEYIYSRYIQDMENSQE